jgi:hypothetical protein
MSADSNGFSDPFVKFELGTSKGTDIRRMAIRIPSS